MSYTNKLQQIDTMKQAIEKHGELSTEILNKINYKFRLEWNYTSNSMEGNSLTKQETRSVMVGNISVEGKPIKDFMEIKGHDEVILDIIKIGKGELNISEKRIKEIHKGIIYEGDPEKRKQIGLWKNEPNYLTNYKNERFDFTAPADVPEKMHDLINWLNTEKEKIQRKDKNALNPVQLALQFHLNYITIHPFYDGNGRTVRILTNLILISYGYPPIYIKENEKDSYYQYLADIQGYGGAPDLFYDFMAGLLIRSMQIVLDAIEGKDIEDPDDLDKKIFLLERELEGIDSEEEVKIQLNKEVFYNILETWFSDLLLEVIPVVQKFNKFFTGTNHSISIVSGMGYINFANEPAKEVVERFTAEAKKNTDRFTSHLMELRFQTFYGTLIKGGLKTFGCNYGFEVKLDQIKYEIFVDDFIEESGSREAVKMYERLLHKPLNKTEIEHISKVLGDTIYKHIDFNTKKKGLR